MRVSTGSSAVAAWLPADAWERTVHYDSHGAPLVRQVAELELGMGESGYGPTTGLRLIAATVDPATLKPENTWYLATTLPLEEASPGQVYELYRLRDWIEHYYKPAKHELGWADYQVRPQRAIVRHWHLVMLAYTFSLLVGAVPTSTGAAPPPPSSAEAETAAGKKIRATTTDQSTHRQRIRGAGRLERHAAAGAQLALPLGSAAGILATLVQQRPTARAGRAPRPSRSLASP
jgi:Transposase DDE domain